MSLICGECSQDIEYGQTLRAIGNGVAFTAVCPSCLDRLPASSLTKRGAGFAIHEATAGQNFTGSYMWSNFKAGKIIAYIDRRAVKRYLSGVVEKLEEKHE